MCQHVDMSEMGDAPADLGHRIGYAIKHAQATLRTRMDSALRGLGLTVPQYVCLEHLRGGRELTNADLARRAFVTAQSMNLVVRGLEERGLVERSLESAVGRREPVRLTGDGETALDAADARVREIEGEMLRVLGEPRADRLLDALGEVTRVLRAADAHG